MMKSSDSNRRGAWAPSRPPGHPAPLTSLCSGADCPMGCDGLSRASCQDRGRGRQAQNGDPPPKADSTNRADIFPRGLRLLNTVLRAATAVGLETDVQPKPIHRAGPRAKVKPGREVGQPLTQPPRAPGPSVPSPPVRPSTHAGLVP